MFAGSCPPALVMAAWMSCAAASMLRLRVNCTVITVVACELVELMLSTPAMVENSRSSGVATEDAMVSGFAPGSEANT